LQLVDYALVGMTAVLAAVFVLVILFAGSEGSDAKTDHRQGVPGGRG
jgi:hypothetical protein